MTYRIQYSRKWAAYRVLILSDGRPVQTAGWWSIDEFDAAQRWARAAVACYSATATS